jgi:hypothetical protein
VPFRFIKIKLPNAYKAIIIIMYSIYYILYRQILCANRISSLKHMLWLSHLILCWTPPMLRLMRHKGLWSFHDSLIGFNLWNHCQLSRLCGQWVSSTQVNSRIFLKWSMHPVWAWELLFCLHHFTPEHFQYTSLPLQ